MDELSIPITAINAAERLAARSEAEDAEMGGPRGDENEATTEKRRRLASPHGDRSEEAYQTMEKERVQKYRKAHTPCPLPHSEKTKKVPAKPTAHVTRH